MKKLNYLSPLLILLSISFSVKAQTPGPFELTPSTPPTGFSTTHTISPWALGIGTVKAPDGWGEFRWCHTNGTIGEKGLIVTREICNPNLISTNSTNNNWTYDPNHTLGTGGGGTGGGWEPQFSNVPVPYTLGTIPFSYYSPWNPTGPNNPSPSLILRSGQQPLFQARTVEYPSGLPGGSGSIKSRFIVMPDGNSGFNTEDPRAALDVQDANISNVPVAIFGNVLPFSQTNLPPRTNAGGAPIQQTFTRHIAIVPRLANNGYNFISRAEDIGIFFTNGLGQDGSNTNGAFVLAPFTKDQNVGGLRMDANGNLEVRGEIKTTRILYATKWWPDYVFANNYNLRSIDSLSAYIKINKHLPEMPSQDSVIKTGQDLGSLQRLQQLKIEELTLYIIQQNDLLKQQQAKLEELESKIAEMKK